MKKRRENRFNLVDVFNCFSKSKVKSETLFIDRDIREKDNVFINKIFKNKEYIIFHLGAGHPLREWGTDNFAELAEKILNKFDVYITLTGTKNERELGKNFTNSP